MGIVNFFKHLFCGIACYVGSFVILLMRLYWGYKFFQAGYGKLGDIGATQVFFESLGIMYPLYAAWTVAIVETVGGLALMVGFLSRLVAIPLSITMIVAYCTAHRDALLGIFSDPQTFMNQEPFMFMLTALLVFSYGAGKFSIDNWCSKKKGCCSHHKGSCKKDDKE